MGSIAAFPHHPIKEQAACECCDVLHEDDDLDEFGTCESCRELDDDYRRERSTDIATESHWELDYDR